MLELKNISFSAENDEGKKEIIHNVSLKLNERFIALTGPNGGGNPLLQRLSQESIPRQTDRLYLTVSI